MEAKKVRQGTAVVQDDLEKWANVMKDAIDDISNQGINVCNVEVIGLHIVGTEGCLYAMKLEAMGIYVLRSITVIYTPISHFNFGVFATTINVLVHVQKRLEKTISDILAIHAAGEQGQDWMRPVFDTPAFPAPFAPLDILRGISLSEQSFSQLISGPPSSTSSLGDSMSPTLTHDTIPGI